MCEYTIVTTNEVGVRVGSFKCDGFQKCLRRKAFEQGIKSAVGTTNDAFVNDSNCQNDTSSETIKPISE